MLEEIAKYFYGMLRVRVSIRDMGPYYLVSGPIFPMEREDLISAFRAYGVHVRYVGMPRPGMTILQKVRHEN